MEVQQIIQDKGSLIRWGRSLDLDGSMKERIDAKADAFAWIVNKLNDYSFDERVRKEMLNIKPEIYAKLPPSGGVLVCVCSTQSSDFGFKSFDSIYVASAGSDMRIELARETKRPKMRAWVHGAYQTMEMYFWISTKEIDKEEET